MTDIGDLTAEPVKLVVTGGIGMGKSTLLEDIRRRLREAGRSVLARPPQAGDPAAALVVDDAHLLTPAALGQLAHLADDPAATLVIATESRDHDPHLRDLMAALERHRPRITLQPLTSGEISRLLADPSGHPPAAGTVATVLNDTAGIPLLVTAVAARQTASGGAGRAAFFALAERLRRLDGAQLEALLIATLSPELGAADVAGALHLSGEIAYRLIDQARGTGLAEPSQPTAFRETVHQAVAQIIGTVRHHEIESALLTTQLTSATLSPELALHLGEHGLRDPGLADTLRAQATEAHNPAARARILRAALQAGATGVGPGLAEALALGGQYSAAAELADDLLTTPEPAGRATGVRVAAALAAHDGNIAQAAELFSWLGPYPDAPTAAGAVIAHLGTGDAAGARAALTAEHAGPPTAAARAARSLADGLLMTITGPYPAAAAKLGQAAAGERTAGLLPDSTAALVTLAALHNGDSARARSVIGRALANTTDPGDPLFAHRHRLLAAWIRMQEGRLHAGGQDVASAPGLHRRDLLWAAALRTAMARRGGDAGMLQKYWYDGIEALAEYAVDLYTLLPLGELWVAAARLHQADRMAPFLDQAFGVLAALGDPPAWSLPLHWAGVHAGILGNDPAAVAPHGQALAAAAAASPFAAALAAAGRTWLRVLARQVDPDEVMTAARGLARFGLTSDATRLAGQAALSADEPKVSALMLQIARDLRVPAADAGDAGSTPAAAQPHRPPAALSEREREVAELLLLGMPYRDIGARLFISAKTVEHHVARIRRRLGAQSRSEMLSMLRAVLEPAEAGSPAG